MAEQIPFSTNSHKFRQSIDANNEVFVAAQNEMPVAKKQRVETDGPVLMQEKDLQSDEARPVSNVLLENDKNDATHISQPRPVSLASSNGQRQQSMDEQKSDAADESSSNVEEKMLRREQPQENDVDDGMSVPNWLIESLGWVPRVEMANSSLSFSCRMFQRLCWPKLHENVEAGSAYPCGIYCGELDELGTPQAVLCHYHNMEGEFELRKCAEEAVTIPMASCEPPEYIRHFSEIHLWFLDAKVLQFLEIGLKKDKISLKPRLAMNEWKENEITALRKLLEIFRGRITELDFGVNNWNLLCEYNQLFPEFFDQIQALNFFAEDDSQIEFFYNWLMKRRQNDAEEPKFCPLVIDDDKQPAFIERIKQEFIDSTKPNPFIMDIIVFKDTQPLMHADFRMENEQTGEILKLYHKKDERRPIGTVYFSGSMQQRRRGQH